MKARWLLLSFVISLLLLCVPLAFAQDETEAETVGLSAEEIAAYPEPNVTQIYSSPELLQDRVYRRVNGAVEIRDAPNGNVLSTLGAGFNFVTVLGESNGWSQISEGHWVRSDALTPDVPVSTFAGVLLPEEGLEYPMAWTLVNLYPSLMPGGDPSESNELLLRYTKVNIYASVELDGWRWYQVGFNQWVLQTQVAKILPVERPEEVDTERWISVDLYEQVVIAYEGETPVFASMVASGLPQWSTEEGLFHIYVRYPRTIMSGSNGLPDFYYLEEVPWTMYFNRDMALHGAYWHDGFGYRRSHGCVNMTITDAHWLYQWASEEFDFTVAEDLGATVLVYSSDNYR